LSAISRRALWLRLFLPFAAGYLLSYLFRTSNAVIGPVLARDLALPDHALGLLTSTYFLAFGAAQLPLGILLDRYGPRRVESILLLIAASGAVLFAMADDLAGLAWGRALIGLGVSACLMAAFKAFNQSFPPDRQASLIGWIMAAGGLGAVFAAQPLEAALALADWRDVTLGLAAVTVVVSLVIWLVVPDKGGPSQGVGIGEQVAGVRQVMTDRQFWRYAPMVAVCIGGFMAIQGLWVARWMAEVEGLDRPQIARQLTLLNAAMLFGCLFMGFVTTPLIRRGVPAARILNVVAIVSIAVFAGINATAGHGQGWLWAVLAFVYPLSNISYTIVAQSLPLSLSGRANTALNLAAFIGAFGLQWGMGLVVDAMQTIGWTASQAYRATFLAVFVLQLAAVAWMLAAGALKRQGAARQMSPGTSES
jgi:predicted MFS family arabinose efflux permease